jgi:hypothetical protein
MPHRVPKSARRFAQLVKELNRAIVDNDSEREARLSELESIAALIRDPKVESRTPSRERKRVIAAINRSLEKIRKYDPRLAKALGGALKTRGFFSYSPESTGLVIEGADPPGSESIKKLPRRR